MSNKEWFWMLFIGGIIAFAVFPFSLPVICLIVGVAYYFLFDAQSSSSNKQKNRTGAGINLNRKEGEPNSNQLVWNPYRQERTMYKTYREDQQQHEEKLNRK